MEDMSEELVVFADDPEERVAAAVADIRAGKMVILVDDEDRENEGDLVMAAEKVTPEAINFMATHARGLICLTLTARQVERLNLPMMATNNQSAYQTAFTVSIEAREGVTTGISAADRALTTLVAIDPEATPRSVVTPGHVFPLRARDGGVLERVGQTEGSVDLAKMAGLNPSGVICEIMNADGTMARMDDLKAFGREHGIRIVTVADLIKHRMRSERVVVRESSGEMAIDGHGVWNAHLYRSVGSPGTHLALYKGDVSGQCVPVRVQPAPPPWAFLGDSSHHGRRSAREALRHIEAHGSGVLVLMHLSPDHEVLGASFQREVGGEAERPVPLAADALRDLGTGCQILRDLGVGELTLLSTSSRPIVGIEAYGLRIVERVQL
jgi:3,4-dihydroxy 2-butanone 4-phosphate synthase/GTP cyclohydrolase II